MPIDIGESLRTIARATQRRYAAHIRRGETSRDEGSPGGSLSQRVLADSLLRFERWGFVYTPSRISRSFNLWWTGTKRQPARGADLAPTPDDIAGTLEREAAKQFAAMDRAA